MAKGTSDDHIAESDYEDQSQPSQETLRKWIAYLRYKATCIDEELAETKKALKYGGF